MSERKRDFSGIERSLPNGAARCTGTSKTSGKQCRQPAAPGTTVCRYHGSEAPQTKRKANLRLAELVDPAIGTLGRVMVNAAQDSVKLAAANSILDRAGYGRVQKIEQIDARDLLLQRLIELRDGAA